MHVTGIVFVDNRQCDDIQCTNTFILWLIKFDIFFQTQIEDLLERINDLEEQITQEKSKLIMPQWYLYLDTLIHIFVISEIFKGRMVGPEVIGYPTKIQGKADKLSHSD